MDETIDINLLLRDPNADISAVMTELRSGRITPMPATGTFKKQLDPKQHDVMDPQLRPDKLVNIDPDSADYGATRSIMVNQEGSVPEKHRIEKVARIAMPWQQLIVNRAVGITFGNPVKYRATPEDDQQKSLMAAILRVMSDNKEPTVNRRVARELYGMTEVAERWYVTEGEKPHYNYSQKGTKFKLRVVTYSPAKGDNLYPYFNEDRDLVAFSREYTRKDSKGKSATYFETLTSDYFYLWKNDGDSQAQGNHWQMVEGYPKPNPYGKIPVIYGCQEKTEFNDVQMLIDRMEKLVSNFADTNDYHASPKIVVKGHVVSFCKKGEAGAVLELDSADADAKYLEWSQAPESVKLEYNILKEMLHTLTQTPDISWDSVKGLNVSGVALELMFMDALLKVKDKEEVWLEYLTRRVNLLKAMLATIDLSFQDAADALLIEPQINPFVIHDKQNEVNVLLSASGQKQLMSQRSAIAEFAHTDDPDAELDAIRQEEEAAGMFEQGEPTMA